MFNGIGLRTPRGSGTNGYVQRSLATLPPQRIADTGRQADGITRPMMRADPAILLHERLRSVEVKLMELRIKLEGTMPLEDIEKRINEEREVLLSQLESEKDDVPIKETNESHALAAVKAKQLEVMKRALKIDKEPGRMSQNRSDDPMDGLRDDDEIDEEHSLENGKANRYEDVRVVNGDNNKDNNYSRSHSKVRRNRSHSDRSFVSSSDESSPPRRRHRNPSYSPSRSRSRSRHSYHRRSRHRRRSYTSSRERYRRGRRSRYHRRDRRRSYTPSVSSYSEEEYRRTKRDKYRHRRSRSPINRYSYSSIDSFKDNDRKMSTRKNEKFYSEERKSSTRKNGVKSVEDRDKYSTKRSINKERYSPRNTRRHGSSDRSLSSVSSRRDRTSSSSIEITRGIRPRASSTSSSNMSRSNSRNRRNRRHYS